MSPDFHRACPAGGVAGPAPQAGDFSCSPKRSHQEKGAPRRPLRLETIRRSSLAPPFAAGSAANGIHAIAASPRPPVAPTRASLRPSASVKGIGTAAAVPPKSKTWSSFLSPLSLWLGEGTVYLTRTLPQWRSEVCCRDRYNVPNGPYGPLLGSSGGPEIS